MNFGSTLREIRKNWGKSIEEVSRYIGISTDMMSKIERGERKPTLKVIKKLTLYYNLHEDDLKILFYTEEIIGLLDGVEIKNLIVKEVRKWLNDPNHRYRVRNTNPLKPEKVPKKRIFLGGGTRVRGFGFYLRNDKLIRRERDILLTQSEHYIGIIEHEGTGRNIPIHKRRGELDSSLTDLEIVGDWNDFFQEHGHRFPEFEKESLKVYGKPPTDYKPTRKKKSDTEFTPPKFVIDFLNKKKKPISWTE